MWWSSGVACVVGASVFQHMIQSFGSCKLAILVLCRTHFRRSRRKLAAESEWSPEIHRLPRGQGDLLRCKREECGPLSTRCVASI